jgi:hypothetical protein
MLKAVEDEVCRVGAVLGALERAKGDRMNACALICAAVSQHLPEQPIFQKAVSQIANDDVEVRPLPVCTHMTHTRIHNIRTHIHNTFILMHTCVRVCAPRIYTHTHKQSQTCKLEDTDVEGQQQLSPCA